MPGDGLYVQGIEVTQTVQYYRSEMHLSDPLDRAPDNAARLVADKPAWARVYVRSAALTPNVTGTLRIERGLEAALLAELVPQPPGTVTALPEPNAPPLITPQVLYRWERRTLAATLNFVIPADLMCGQLRLTARISAPDGQSHQKAAVVNVTLHQRARFRGIMVGYSGVDPATSTGQATAAPPTLADLQATSPLTLQMFPVSSTASYESAGTLTISTPLGGNGCSAGDKGWASLMLKLDAAVAADGAKPGRLYYGLIGSTVPGPTLVTPGGGGCNSGSAAAGYAALPFVDRVMAHEIGHFFHPHAPCGNPGGVDTNYPVYEPYAPASVGEYGLNLSTGEVAEPDTHYDIMSYCPPNLWMSPYGHALCVNHALLNPTTVCDPKIELYYPPKGFPVMQPDPVFPFAPARPRPIIALAGILDLMGRLVVESVYRTVAFARSGGRPTALVAVLDGPDGQPLASAPVVSMAETPCGCSDCDGPQARLVKAVLPDVGPGTALRVLRDGEEVWRRAAPQAPPRVTGVSAQVGDDHHLVVRWRGSEADPSQRRYWVRWSDDGGESWSALGTDIMGTEARFSLDGLPAGGIQVHVVAHDGFFSTISEPVALTLPPRSPVVSILHPREGSAVPAGGTLHLWAAVTPGGEAYEPDDIRWLVDGREAGRGSEAWSVAPAAGEHQCTLRLEGDGGRFERTVRFRTVTIPRACDLPVLA